MKKNLQTKYHVYLKNQHDQFLKDREEEFRIYCQKGYSASQEFVKEWNKKYQNEMKKFNRHVPTFEELWDTEIKKGNPIDNTIATNIVLEVTKRN